jgi:actin related protein 2/3 complex subunit 5
MVGGADTQDLTTQAVLLILNSTRAADIPNAIKGLDHEQQAYLMAYLYKVR